MATNKNDPSLTYTLDDFVAMQMSDDMTYYNFSILEVVNSVEHLNINLVEEYSSVLKSQTLQVELTDEEYKKYKYCPDLLAYDVYGSVQLDFVILILNDIFDPKEFVNKTIRLVPASVLQQFLNEVYGKEYGWIQQNRADYGLLI
jgi:hypothetical protein